MNRNKISDIGFIMSKNNSADGHKNQMSQAKLYTVLRTEKLDSGAAQWVMRDKPKTAYIFDVISLEVKR